MVQWLRICLPMQGTWLQSLARLDFTGHGATKPVCHNCWACTLQNPGAATTEAHTPRSQGFTGENTTMRSPHATTKRSPYLPQLEKAPTQQGSPSTTKTKKKKKKQYVQIQIFVCIHMYVHVHAYTDLYTHTHLLPIRGVSLEIHDLYIHLNVLYIKI